MRKNKKMQLLLQCSDGLCKTLQISQDAWHEHFDQNNWSGECIRAAREERQNLQWKQSKRWVISGQGKHRISQVAANWSLDSTDSYQSAKAIIRSDRVGYYPLEKQDHRNSSFSLSLSLSPYDLTTPFPPQCHSALLTASGAPSEWSGVGWSGRGHS